MLLIPTTTHVTKKVPPSTVLRPTSHVPSPINKTMLEKKSAAPLPRESKVTQQLSETILVNLISFQVKNKSTQKPKNTEHEKKFKNFTKKFKNPETYPEIWKSVV